MSSEKKLTTKQLGGVAALLSTNTREDAAKQAGVNARTLKRWEQLPEFRAALQEGRRTLFRAAVDRVLNRLDKAVETVERNLSCGMPSTEVRSAGLLLDAALKWHEADVSEQIDEIRRQVEVLKSAKR